MNCSACGHRLPERAKFCPECGAPVTAAGAASPPPAAAAAPLSGGARKIVTILFADLAGSTALHERLDPESARQFMERYYRAMRGAIAAHGGTVVKLLGDGVLAAFGVPRVNEDDAMRAVRAACAMREAFAALSADRAAAVGAIGLRLGINTGEVVVGADDTDIVGDPVNVAARLQEEAGTGEVVIGEATQRLVADKLTLAALGRVALKGRAESVDAYRVVSLERPAGAAAAAFVGRAGELARLQAAYDAAVAAPAARLAVLLGSPGLGKSRLIDETCRRLGRAATVITAHCDAAGGATFAPLADALRRHFAVDAAADRDAIRAAVAAALPAGDAERQRIAAGVAALLTGSPAAPEETFFVVRRLLAALAAARPVVLVIDDLHWAEPLLLDLIEHLVQWGSGVPLLLLIGARPELRELRPALATPGGAVAELLTLGGLDAGAATRLAANVVGAADLPAAVAAKVLATSEGNPLFVGELMRMLVQEGALTRDGDRWTVGANLAALEMPPTIQALLAARIERLPPEQRAVLECAAVVGRHFAPAAVAALLPEPNGTLAARLEALCRTELIERDGGRFLGEPMLRFHHVLIRDAAYRRLLKGTRAELHERLADWIATQSAAAASEHDESIGWHFEQAHQHLRELGPLDDKGKTLGVRAAAHLAAAGRRALARDDVPLAAGLLGRAVERLEADDPSRPDLLLDWCEALLSAGDVGSAARAIDTLRQCALPAPAQAPRLAAWHTCFAGQLTVLTAPASLQAAADAVAGAAEALARLGDAAGEAKAHSVHAQALARLGKVGASEAALDKALAAARTAGDRRRANAVLAGAPPAALWGPSPVTRASGRCLDVVRVLRITEGAPAVEAVALSCQGILEALRGRTDAARRMVAAARKMVEDLGIAQRLFEADVFAGRIDLLEGDAAAAARTLRAAYDGLRDLGLGIDAARAGALLARAQLRLGKIAEAQALSHDSEALAGDDLQAAIAWRGVRAEALARRGDTKAAVELAQAAVAIAAATDALLDHADARMALAASLRADGRTSEADAEERRAIELWQAKGASLLAERAGRAAAPSADAAPSVDRAAPATPRLLRPNAGSATLAQLETAMNAGDIDTAVAMIAADAEEVSHPNGITYGRDAMVASLRRFLNLPGARVRHEPLATLGESLWLFRRWMAADAAGRASFDVGPFEKEEVGINEIDERGLHVRNEIFAADRLGDAVARLYARYAELLPAGPSRQRAAATAQSAAVFADHFDIERFAAAMAPDIRVVDDRRVGLGSIAGAEALLRALRALLELSDDFDWRLDDVLALHPDALLARMTTVGVDRRSGSTFERPVYELFVCGADGRIARWERFDVARVDDALRRFVELTAAGEPAPAGRQTPRANAASAVGERIDAAFAQRDGAALDRILAEPMTLVQHPAAAAFDRDQTLAAWRAQVESGRRLVRRHHTLATLGDALALDRVVAGSDGPDDGAGPAAPALPPDSLLLTEVTPHGRVQRFESFAPDRLGDAVVRLYERFAERLPEGAARRRAAATARAVADMAAPPDLARYAAALAPDVEFIDHRTVGFASGRGADRLLRGFASLLEVADGVSTRVEEIFALHADGLLMRWTTAGIDRAGGGAFESSFLLLWTFGDDGRIVRDETFDEGRRAEAVARFEALTARGATASERRVINSASAALQHLAGRLAAGDWAGADAAFATDCAVSDRRRADGAQRAADFLREQRALLEAGCRWSMAPVATRGARLALSRVAVAAAADAGPRQECLCVAEVDAGGRFSAIALYPARDLDGAHAELDRRYGIGEAAGGAAWSRIRAMNAAIYRRDRDAILALMQPTFHLDDHRRLGWGKTLDSPDQFCRSQAALVDLAPDLRYRIDHFDMRGRAFITCVAQVGSRDGGAFEIPFSYVGELDAADRLMSFHLYDPDELDAALATFEAIAQRTTGAAPANAASRTREQVDRAVMANDWDTMRGLARPDMAFEDRRHLTRISGDIELWIKSSQAVLVASGIAFHDHVLATFGDRIDVRRRTITGYGPDGGRFEMEFIVLTEVDAGGRLLASINYDVDASAEADAEARRRAASG